MKIDRLRKCYALDMPSDEYRPIEVAAGLTQVICFPDQQPSIF